MGAFLGGRNITKGHMSFEVYIRVPLYISFPTEPLAGQHAPGFFWQSGALWPVFWRLQKAWLSFMGWV